MRAFRDACIRATLAWSEAHRARAHARADKHFDALGAAWTLIDHGAVDVIAVTPHGDGLAIDFVAPEDIELVCTTEGGDEVYRSPVSLDDDAGLRICSIPRPDDTDAVLFLDSLTGATSPVRIAYGHHRSDPARRIVQIHADQIGNATFTW